MKLSDSLIRKLEALRHEELETGSVADAHDLEELLSMGEIGDYDQGYEDGKDDADCWEDHCDSGYCRPIDDCCDCPHAE